MVEVLQDGQSVPPSGPPTITDRSTPSSDRSPATCTRTCSAAAGGCESRNTSTISAWDTSRPGCSASNPSSARGIGARTDSSTPPRRTTSGPNTPTDNTSAAGAPSTAVNRRSDDSRGRTAPRSMARTDRTLNPERLASSSCVHPSRCR